MIRKGTNRWCIVGKRFTYKFPLFRRGWRANRLEYANYLRHPDIIARTEKHWWGLKQETLTNLTVYPILTDKCDLAPEHQHLHQFHTHSRIQVGQDANGVWKFYDYEDIKYQDQGGYRFE